MTPNALLRASACLLSWKRPHNLAPIVASLDRLEFIDEILIWNNDPSTSIDVPSAKARVIISATNEGCYGRYLCAREARNEVVYVQDDDVIVHNVAELYRRFVGDPTRIAHALRSEHLKRQARQHYDGCHVALVGWGAFFQRSWLRVLDSLPAEVRESSLFRREADKYFSLLLERRHQTIPGELTHLDGHSSDGQALWREPDHFLKSALAVRAGLALVRARRPVPTPPPWHVVVPCYNYARFLEEAVFSVLRNDADYVVTVIDDASTDETPEVAAALAAAYRHVRYRRLAENVGPGGAVNRAIAEVPSVFALRLDADDRIGPDYLFEAQRVLDAGADIANTDAILFGDRESRWSVPETVTLPMLLARNPVHGISAFRRGLWETVGGYDESIPGWDDYELWIRMAAAGARIRRVPGDHFWYRKHGYSRNSRSTERAASLRAYIEQKHRPLFQGSAGIATARSGRAGR